MPVVGHSCFTETVARRSKNPRDTGGRRAGVFGRVEQRETRTGPRWRAVWPCAACQAEADEQHAVAIRRAERKGEAFPRRPRVLHRTGWSDDQGAVTAVMDEIRRDRETARLQRWGDVCWVDEHDEGQALDERIEGPRIAIYAERVLSRATGAESTKDDDRRLWEEEVEHPDLEEEALGLGERFGHRGVRSVTRAEVREWLEETRKRPGRVEGSTLSASQVRQRFYLLKRVFAAAVDDDALDLNPCAGVKPPPLPQGRAVTGLMRAEADSRWLPTEEDMRQIVAAMPLTTGLAAALAFGAGLRIGEVTALLRADLVQVSKTRWTVRIQRSESQRGGRTRSATKTGASGQGTRHLPEWIGSLVEEYLEETSLNPAERLFPAMRGQALSLSHTKIRGDLRKALAGLGLGTLSPQDLRAAGEAHVARLIGRPDAASWARHGLAVQMAHYVAAEKERASLAAAGWSDAPTDAPATARTRK